jgi:hypothetical protein
MFRNAIVWAVCLPVFALTFMNCGGAGSGEPKAKFVEAEMAKFESKTDVPVNPPKVLIKYSYRVKGEANVRRDEVQVDQNDTRAPLTEKSNIVVCYQEGHPETSRLLRPSGKCDDLKFEDK